MRKPQVYSRCRLMLAAICFTTACSPSPEHPDLLVVDRRPHPDHGLYLVQESQRAILFAAEPLGHLLQVAYSAARRQCVFAYNPPPQSGQNLSLNTNLYTLSVDSPSPTPEILLEAATNEVLLDPVFSPDSQRLYWVKAVTEPETNSGTLALQVTELDSMRTSKILDNAIWPAPSPVSPHLAYVAVDPLTLARGLSIYDLRTAESETLIEIDAFSDIDAPLYSADGDWIYFFGPAPVETTVNWLQWLGIRTAHAHINRPGIWWKISKDGATMLPVTADAEIISNATRSSSGVLTYTSSLGVRLLSGDESIRTLLPEPFFGGVAEYAR